MASTQLERNRAAVLERIQSACATVGRDPAGVRLVAVTKAVEPEVAAALYHLGEIDLGESRVPELERKARWFEQRGLAPRWHFIGHLQRNKARRVVQLAHSIHSVDSLRLLETLGRLAQEEGRELEIYLQVKLTSEEAKGGLREDELEQALSLAGKLEPGLRPSGLMTMAPQTERPERGETAELVFERLAGLARELGHEAFGREPRLSMGMSGDFECAVAHGAHLVRVGSALFEEHTPHATPSPHPGHER